MDEALQERFLETIRGRPELMELAQELDTGAGTYAVVNKMAEILGDEMATFFDGVFDAETLTALAKKSHEIITMASEIAQTNLNNAAGIGLKPLTKKYPAAAMATVADRLGSVEADTVMTVAKDVLPTAMIQMVDDNVRYNADFQAKAGLKPLIVRTWSGRYPSHDTKHTDWCHDLAGTYEYGKEPNRVFARHEGCRCTVEYFPNARAKGRITALSKGEVDRDSVLWNTKEETLAKRLKKAGL